MMFSQWARKELQRGDLSALSEVAKRRGQPDPDRIQRLNFRGFVVVKKANDRLTVTLKGRAALWVRRRSG